MSTAVQTGGKPRRRLPIGRIVLAVILIAIITEPIMMYHSLLRQREARQIAEQSSPMLGASSGPSSAEAGR